MKWVLLVIAVILLIVFVASKINKRRFVKLFNSGNVLVSGMKGRGKDFAFCVVINARKKNYISNVQYSDPKKKYQRFDFDTKVWELSGNTYTDLVDGTIKKYTYPYPDGIDYYISDAGLYFPAQYQSELVKRYKAAPMFQALSRHLGDCAVHCNVQVQNRLWDKIREQSDTYVVMKSCRHFFGKLFRLTAYSYSLEESAEKQIVPPHFGIGKRGKDQRFQFEVAHGVIKRYAFFAKLPYRYDSRRFKRILENNLIDYEGDSYAA